MDVPPIGRDYGYEELLALHAAGRYPGAPLRAASGRENVLLGLTPAQLERMRSDARAAGLGLLLMGSRVSGPRSRQRALHPALPYVLPLKGTSRAPSAGRPGADSGLDIDKTRIKDYGREDLRGSDLAALLLARGRPAAEVDAAAKRFEAEWSAFTEAFPVSVFGHIRGERYEDEADFLAKICAKLAPKLPPGMGVDELKTGFREVYAPL